MTVKEVTMLWLVVHSLLPHKLESGTIGGTDKVGSVSAKLESGTMVVHSLPLLPHIMAM
jgi:hypothetical protein